MKTRYFIIVLLLIGACMKVNERGETPCQEKARLEMEVKAKEDSLRIAKIVIKKVNAIAEDEQADERPIPLSTTFKVSDRVCITDLRVCGVVLEIYYSDNPPEGHPDVLVYTIKYYVDGEEQSGDFYDTELTKD